MTYLCSMASKNNHKEDIKLASFDDIKVIGINTSLIDFKLAWHINQALSINLARYDDIQVEDIEYSFYYYTAGEKSNVYNLVSLTRNNNTWMSLSPRVDYILIIRNDITAERLNHIVKSIRGINAIGHAFLMDLNKNKDLFIALETIELHEIGLMEKWKKRKNLKTLKQEMKKAMP